MPTYLLIFNKYKEAMTEIRENKKQDHFFLIVSVGLIILLISLYTLIQPTQFGKNSTKVTIGENIITAEISDSEEGRIQGLSGRKSLPENHGMLFVFEEANKYSFWMKDMKFPIDIIWINKGEIVDITYHVNPEATDAKSLTTYQPKESAQYVLEVNANYAREKGIKIGDLVEISGLK